MTEDDGHSVRRGAEAVRKAGDLVGVQKVDIRIGIDVVGGVTYAVLLDYRTTLRKVWRVADEVQAARAGPVVVDS